MEIGRNDPTRNRAMPVWKQITGVAFSLCVGGYAGALFATAQNLGYTPLVAIVTIPAALFLGLPCFFTLRRFQLLNIGSASLVGVVGSMLVSSALLALRHRYVSDALSLDSVIIGLVSSLVAFLTIWVFDIPTRRPPRN
jgi:hypothetical protein